LVDLLGGDGLLYRACRNMGVKNLSVLTCDLSPHMVSAAWERGAPALLQAAEEPLLKSSSVDVVLLAYGSHHIAPSSRQQVVEEAYRMLRTEGIFVLHDFPQHSPAEQWFREVADRYSKTGHKFDHFTSGEIADYLKRAGFAEIRILEIDDSYSAVGLSEIDARMNIGKYLVKMYGLMPPAAELEEQSGWLWAADRAQEIFQYDDNGSTAKNGQVWYDPAKEAWRISVPRRAIVGIGRKVP